MRRFMNATFFSAFSALILFNHLTDRVCNIVEITDERHDGRLGDNLKDVEVMPDYIRKKDKSTFVNKFLGNTGNDELEYCLKTDVICTIAVGIEEDNEKRLNGLWADFNRQVIEETNVSFKNIF